MDARIFKILELLSNNNVTFFIPPYQRNYEWEKTQCEVFFDDILKTYKVNKDGANLSHFFGTVTYLPEETATFDAKKLILIDGQQRITTTMLFLIAMRDATDDDNLKTRLNNRYLKNEYIDNDSEYKIKLKQTESDWKVYKKIILGDEKLTEKEKASPLYKNYIYFFDRIVKECREYSFDEIIKLGMGRFSVVTIELVPQNDSENPQEIFESMNSLGKPLSLSDLVRNYLLLGLTSKEQIDLYNKYWLHIETVLLNSTNISFFIRDYMQMVKSCAYPQASVSNYKTLYIEFKKIFHTNTPEDVLRKLSFASDFYANIFLGTPTGDALIDKVLSDLRPLKKTTAYSFVLLLLIAHEKKKLTGEDVFQILDALRIYEMRRKICGLTQADNKTYPTFCNEIADIIEANNKRNFMFYKFADYEFAVRVPNDIEIKNELQEMNFYNFALSKYFLCKIEQALTKSMPDMSDKNLQIEHIMPQHLTEEWKNNLGENFEEIHVKYINNIGNLTLIRHNQELGQDIFQKKKEIYKNNAGLQIAKTKITSEEKWGEEEIIKRQDWLIDFMLKNVIPIPDEMRTKNNYNIGGKQKERLSFRELNLIGEEIYYTDNPKITAKVISDKEVEFEGTNWKLSPLTRELKIRTGTVSNSGAYQGANYWGYKGVKLVNLMSVEKHEENTSTKTSASVKDVKDNTINVENITPTKAIAIIPGANVEHRALGEGIVKSVDNDRVTIYFAHRNRISIFEIADMDKYFIKI